MSGGICGSSIRLVLIEVSQPFNTDKILIESTSGMSMKRRQALLSICTAVSGAGCLRVGPSQPKKSRLAWIWLLNDRDEPYEVDVVVEDASEIVFSESYELTAEPDTANIRENDPVDGTGQYVVRATMDGETREVDTTKVVDGDENCIGVRFSLLNNGSVDYWTKSMQQC